MKRWSAFFDDLMPWLPGCGDAMIEHELRRAAQDFFERSRAWRAVLDAIATEAATAEYDLVTDAATLSVVRIEAAAYKDAPLEILSLPAMADRYGAGWRDLSGAPEAITQVRPGAFLLCPVPEAAEADAIALVVAVKPSDSSAGVDDDIAMRFRDELVTGAKARLLMMPKKPWSDQVFGAKLAGLFNEMIAAARTRAEMAYGGGRIRGNPKWC